VSAGRRLLLALGALTLAGLAFWSLPRLLDWDAQRPRLATVASERLGRPVMLEGPVAFVLLPQPRFEAFGIRVAPGADGIAGEARSLRLRLALGPLLLGRIEVREVALVGAEIRLPWPPATLPGLAPPPWLEALDARIEDSRILLGETAVEGVTGRVTAGGLAEAVRAGGAFRWRGAPVAFEAVLGRAGDDGMAPLDLSLRLAGAAAAARGVLLAEGGFEGRFDAAGPDLAAILPAPPGPFRARGTLRAGAELIAADALVLEGAGGQVARGAASLRLDARPRADLSLAAARLDLAPWLAALRGAGPQLLPLTLDLSAEAAEFGPLRLRRLRGAAVLDGERVSFADIQADLPGGAQAELSGGALGPRLEMSLRLRAARPRELAASLGWAPDLPIPAEAAEGTARLSWEGPTLALTEIVARFGGNRVSGGVTWRDGPRPSLALGLEMDSLALGPNLAPLARLRAIAERADVTLRLATARLDLDGAPWRRVALDGALEGGRAVLRAASGERSGAEFSASGVLALGPQPRLSEAALELRGPAATLARLAGWDGVLPADLPVTLRAEGQGPLDALVLRVEGEAAEARLEAQGTVNAREHRAQGSVTLRHPGAMRLLERVGLPAPWLGPGSLSVILAVAGQPGQWQSDNFDLVAGTLRLRAQGSLSAAARPRLAGRVQAENLPLPPLQSLLDGLPRLDAELALAAQALRPAGFPPLEQVAAELRLGAEGLRVEGLRARLLGGALEGRAAFGATSPPSLSAELALADAAIPGPLTGGAADLVAGRLSAEARLRGAGHSAAALLAALAGEARVELRAGLVRGLDLAAVAAALSLTDPAAAGPALRDAFAGGATPVEALTARLDIAQGRARIAEAALVAEGGVAAAVSGGFDLSGDALDLRVAVPAPGGGEAALRLSGPPASPRRLEEFGAFLRALSAR